MEGWRDGAMERWSDGRMSAVRMNIECVGSVEESFTKANDKL
jgi:hypothetical protein